MSKILTYKEYLRRKAKRNKGEFHLTFGGQYNAFLSDSDITILVGNRGSSKTTTILATNMPHIHTKRFNGYFLRKEVKDSTGGGGIIDASKKFYENFGSLRESLQYLDWVFPSSARISFLNYSAPIDQFKDKVQGKEIDRICIDEIAQMDEEYFNILMANLRNTKDDLKPQIFGTCNPDAFSWIKFLILPYLDLESKYHTHKKDMNGKKLYFFQVGDSIRDSVYGETKEEVYANAKDKIDELVRNSGIENANPLDAILSIRCFYLPKSENIHLMKSKGGGLALDARMQKMSLQERIYAIYGGWKRVDSSDNCIISNTELERFFNNDEVRSGVRYASMDIAGKGKDRKILVIWDGYHIDKILTTDIKDAKGLIEWTRRQLESNNVPLSKYNFVYDSDGLGWAFSGHFRPEEAFPFVANSPASDEGKVDSYGNKKTKVYRNAKAEVVGKFASIMTNYNDTGACGISIDQDLLYSNMFGRSIKQTIAGEIVGLEWRPDLDGIKQLISTKDMNIKIGWHSDLLMAIVYRFALDIAEGDFKYEELEDDDFDDIMSFLS